MKSKESETENLLDFAQAFNIARQLVNLTGGLDIQQLSQGKLIQTNGTYTVAAKWTGGRTRKKIGFMSIPTMNGTWQLSRINKVIYTGKCSISNKQLKLGK